MVFLKRPKETEELQASAPSLEEMKLGKAIEYIIGFTEPLLDHNQGDHVQGGGASTPASAFDAWSSDVERSRFVLPGGDVDFEELSRYLDERLNTIAAGDIRAMEEDGPTRNPRVTQQPASRADPPTGESAEGDVASPLTDEELIRRGKLGPPMVLMPRSGFTGEIRIQRLGVDWQGWPVASQQDASSAASGATSDEGVLPQQSRDEGAEPPSRDIHMVEAEPSSASEQVPASDDVSQGGAPMETDVASAGASAAAVEVESAGAQGESSGPPADDMEAEPGQPAVEQGERRSTSAAAAEPQGPALFSGGLALESMGNFSSARANACVYKGRWMFEATLGTPGIQQIGWATLQCPFTNEEGVGDAPDSYAYDGKRVRKWHVGSERYGEHWLVGDVIGCCIDVDKGEIEFFQNGTSLGLAFQNVRRLDRGLGYFPAVSLSLGERCELNFGGRPFRYPVPGYLPLQAPPQGLMFGSGDSDIQGGLGSPVQGAGEGGEQHEKQRGGKLFCGAEEQALYLLGCLRRLVLEKWADLPVVRRESTNMLSSAKAGGLLLASRLKQQGRPSREEYALIAAALCDRLGPLLLVGGRQVDVWLTANGAPQLLFEAHTQHEQQRLGALGARGTHFRAGYVVWAALVPFLLSLYGMKEPHTVRKLDRVLNLLLLFLDPDEKKAVFPAIMDCLAYHSATTGLSRDTLPWSGSYPYLALAYQLSRRQEILQAWYEAPGFMDCLESLLTRKGGNERERARLLPAVWWLGCKEAEEGCTELQWRQQMALLTESLQKIESQQHHLCSALMSFTPPRRALLWPTAFSTPSAPSLARESGGAFGQFLHALIAKNYGAARNVPPPGLSDSSVLLSAFFVLLKEVSVKLAKAEVEASAGKGGRKVFKYPVRLLLDENSIHCLLDAPRLGGTFGHVLSAFPLARLQDFADVAWAPGEGRGGDGDGRDHKDPKASSGRGSGNGSSTGSSAGRQRPPRGGNVDGTPIPGARGSTGTEGSPAPAAATGASSPFVLPHWHPGGASLATAGMQTPPRDVREGSPGVQLEVPGQSDAPQDGARLEALVDFMTVLFHLSVASFFKQASALAQNQSHAISQLQEADRQLRSGAAASSLAGVGLPPPGPGSSAAARGAGGATPARGGGDAAVSTAPGAAAAAGVAPPAQEAGEASSEAAAEGMDVEPASSSPASQPEPSEGAAAPVPAEAAPTGEARPGTPAANLPADAPATGEALDEGAAATGEAPAELAAAEGGPAAGSAGEAASGTGVSGESVPAAPTAGAAGAGASGAGAPAAGSTGAGASGEGAPATGSAGADAPAAAAGGAAGAGQRWVPRGVEESAREIRERMQHMHEARRVFRDDVLEAVRKSAWLKLHVSGAAWKAPSLLSLSSCIAQFLLAAGDRGPVFAYVPELYIETMVEAFHAFRRADSANLLPLRELQQSVYVLTTFVVTHFNDARIVKPDVKDSLLQLLSLFLQLPQYASAVERNHAARTRLLPALLSSFTARFWVPVSQIFVRLCCADGVVFGGPKRVPSLLAYSPTTELFAPIFLSQLKSLWEEDPVLLTAFVNELFNMLNWTLSEFSIAQKEVVELMSRSARSHRQQQQQQQHRQQQMDLQRRKCSVMFDLSCNLQRIVEILCSQVPGMFLPAPYPTLAQPPPPTQPESSGAGDAKPAQAQGPEAPSSVQRNPEAQGNASSAPAQPVTRQAGTLPSEGGPGSGSFPQVQQDLAGLQPDLGPRIREGGIGGSGAEEAPAAMPTSPGAPSASTSAAPANVEDSLMQEQDELGALGLRGALEPPLGSTRPLVGTSSNVSIGSGGADVAMSDSQDTQPGGATVAASPRGTPGDVASSSAGPGGAGEGAEGARSMEQYHASAGSPWETNLMRLLELVFFAIDHSTRATSTAAGVAASSGAPDSATEAVQRELSVGRQGSPGLPPAAPSPSSAPAAPSSSNPPVPDSKRSLLLAPAAGILMNLFQYSCPTSAAAQSLSMRRTASMGLLPPPAAYHPPPPAPAGHPPPAGAAGQLPQGPSGQGSGEESLPALIHAIVQLDPSEKCVSRFERVAHFPWADEFGSHVSFAKLPLLEELATQVAEAAVEERDRRKEEERRAKAAEAGGGEGTEAAESGEAEGTDTVCSICYSAPIDTLFRPCGHSSCHRCISRHQMNSNRCFFCNATITGLEAHKPAAKK